MKPAHTARAYNGRVFPAVAMVLLSSGLLVRPVPAAERSCGTTGGPAATLLFPYVEVDLGDPEGRTTLISIGNAVARPVVTHVVLWTNRGLPVLDFDLFLPSRGVKPMNLRELILQGRLPVTGPAGGENPFPSCGDPVSVPSLDAAALEELRTRLSGTPNQEGLCWAAPEQGSLVTGFVTVDVVRDCSPQSRHPLTEGYFEADSGAAVDDDVLWGDFFLVDSRNDSAQGLSAVAVPAMAVEPGGRSFYGRGEPRRPLPVRYRPRFFDGGGFDGGTEVLVWIDPFTGRNAEPRPCNAPDRFLVHAEERSESGALGSMEWMYLPRTTHRFPVVTAARRTIVDGLPVTGSFGTLMVCAAKTPAENAGEAEPRSLWAAPIHTALGRFSVGLDSVSRCDDELPEHPIASEVPEWVRRWISEIECEPLDTLAPDVFRYLYKGNRVYFRHGSCCDAFDQVYDENGEYLCAPSGGFAGTGDGKCPDFFDVATDKELLWFDPRFCEAVPPEVCEEYGPPTVK